MEVLKYKYLIFLKILSQKIIKLTWNEAGEFHWL